MVVMDRIQQFLAWYLGLRTPAPGEGTQLRLDWRLPGPSWLIAIAAVALIVFVVWIYRREAQSLRGRQRLALTVLRLLTFLVILGMLTEMSLTVERTGLPSIAVMIDTSASMSLQDQYPAGSAAATLSKAISSIPGRDAHRPTAPMVLNALDQPPDHRVDRTGPSHDGGRPRWGRIGSMIGPGTGGRRTGRRRRRPPRSFPARPRARHRR